MSSYPRKDESARTGSNLRGDPLLAHGRSALARRVEQHNRLAREHSRKASKLFSRKDLRRIGQWSAQLQQVWRRASVEAGGDSARVDELKRSARRKLERAVARELPAYTEWKKLRRSQLREHERLVAAAAAALPANRPHVGWGNVVTLTNGQDFVPPYTVFDVHRIDDQDHIVRDDSFARPEIGHLVNNFDFDQDEDTSFAAGLWGLLLPIAAAGRAACGVSFTTPSPGRIEVHAVLRNFYNKVMYSVHDNFGFSSADVAIELNLFVAIVRGTQVTFLPTTLQTTGLVSHGSDLSYAHSDLDNSVPYTITATTEQRFNANETVLVIAGSEVAIHTLLDDMHCKVDAVLWWQLQKLTIGMAEDIFT